MKHLKWETVFPDALILKKFFFPEQSPRRRTIWTKKPPRRLQSSASSVACSSPPSPFVDVIHHIGSLSTTFQIKTIIRFRPTPMPSPNRLLQVFRISTYFTQNFYIFTTIWNIQLLLIEYDLFDGVNCKLFGPSISYRSFTYSVCIRVTKLPVWRRYTCVCY